MKVPNNPTLIEKVIKAGLWASRHSGSSSVLFFNFTSMQIIPHFWSGSNEENKKALTPDEKNMAFEMTRVHYFTVAHPKNKETQTPSQNMNKTN